MRWIALVLLAACGRGSRPAGVAPCPQASHAGFDAFLWRRAVFPACPPPQFDVDGITCTDCPMPCRRTNEVWEDRYTYFRGQRATIDGKSTRTATATHSRCDYDASGRLTGCTHDEEPVKLKRDEDGRVVEIDRSGHVLEVSYDDRGDLVKERNRVLG